MANPATLKECKVRGLFVRIGGVSVAAHILRVRGPSGSKTPPHFPWEEGRKKVCRERAVVESAPKVAASVV